ncbi:hypothetical protein U9M48_022727 [Paspalum notatum var. saurae]|uniref:Long-chain-alcohol oxidase n=1 Tax=Paspalum notatum var. saurae TaxID=547442 RepID=A0AAQ3TMC4_PASNO
MGAGNNKKRGHPLLRGGARRERYTHGFSASQMAALTALCGALVPRLPPDRRRPHHEDDDGGRGGFCGDRVHKAADVEVEEFLLASAADPPVPDEAAELMSRMCLPEALALVRAVLWLLGTRLGSLALCGAPCLTWRFPFVRRFGELETEQREAALRRWSRQTLLPPLRMFFLITKVFCLYVFYSWTDENSENPHWRAIGYSPPVDDDEPAAEEEAERPEKRPLDDGVVETISETDASLPASLARRGLKVTADAARNACVVECDVAIVGSGCGGGVAAAVLASAGHKVVVIEKGGYFAARDYTAVEAPSMNQLYEGGGFVSTLSGSALLLAGSTVGGGTAVNWSACIKTPDDVRREWAREHGLPLFAADEYAAAMDKVFERLGVTHGCAEEGLQNKVLRRGCEKLGYKVESVARNSSEGHYCGSCGFGCRAGDKRGTDTTWLVDAVRRGAVILTGCKAEKLMLERTGSGGADGGREKRCVGVVARSTNPAITMALEVRARATVSACGSLLTPVLLRGSGLSNRHIGKNLHLHPTALVWGYFPDTTMPDLKGKMYEGGIITSLHKVEGRAILETPAMGVAAAGTQFPWVSGHDMKQRMLRYGRTVHLFSMVRDRGSGTVHGERRIAYHLDATDRENMREGLRRALRVLAAAGAAEIGTHRSDGQRFVCRGATEAALEEFLDGVDVVRGPQSKAEAWSLCCTAHQMGSCRMGATPADGAVDARGESWEAAQLFVCDASVLPTAVGVNPMVTIQSVAYCLAMGIAESLRQQ